VIQNHLLQMLTLVAMEKPSTIGGDIRDAKVAVLKAMEDIDPNDVILGQFTAGKGNPAFLDDDSIAAKDAEKAKHCSTFAQMVVRINNDRWRGVPFVIRAGKGLTESKCEVRIQFKEPTADKQVCGAGVTCPRNELVMRVSPNQAVYWKCNVKTPGLSQQVLMSELDLSYNTRYKGAYSPLAYTRLILAGFRGQHESFVRTDELLRAWEIFSPLLEKIEGGKKTVIPYEFGTRGPPEADAALPKFNCISYRGEYQWSPSHEQDQKVSLEQDQIDEVDHSSKKGPTGFFGCLSGK